MMAQSVIVLEDKISETVTSFINDYGCTKISITKNSDGTWSVAGD